MKKNILIFLSFCLLSFIGIVHAENNLPTPLGSTIVEQALKTDLNDEGKWKQITFADDTTQTTAAISIVEISDLAPGIDGELITWDSSGDPATVAVGTADQVLTSNGPGAAPTFQAAVGGSTINYRSGFNCKQSSTTTITVGGGSIDVDGTTVTKTADTTLTLTTVTDWVDDTSDQAVSTYGYVYINATGKIEMDDVAPDESDTSGNTTGVLRYNDTGTDTSDRRMIGWFFMNATGSGELSSFEVGNLKDGDVHNSVVRTDSTQDAVDDTTYGTDLTNTQIHFYSSGRGAVNAKCHIRGSSHTAGERGIGTINDGSAIVASEDITNDVNANLWSNTPSHAESYAQGGVTFEAQFKVSTGSYTAEEKTMIINEN